MAIAVGLGLSNLRTRSLAGDGARYRPRVGPTARYRFVSVVILGAVTVVTLLPNWPIRSAPSDVPYFFRSALVRQVPLGSTVLTYPFPQYPQNQAMTWQALSGMRFKEVGTYAFVRRADGRATWEPSPLQPITVQQYLTYEERATGATLAPRIARTQLVTDIRAYISAYGIRAVIIQVTQPPVPHVSEVLAVFREALGRPKVSGGVALWIRQSSPLGRS